MSKKKQISKLIRMLQIWFKKNELDEDTIIYSIEEWRKKNEEYHNHAEFVLTAEGSLWNMLNYGDSSELQELASSFGFYFELGNTWSLGFYLIEEFPDNDQTTNRNSLSYNEKLKDTRWLSKRKEILNRAHNKCEDCKSKDRLEIHHCYYLFDYEPWEYPLDSLKCLCRDCHQKRGDVERVLRGNLASLKTKELESITYFINNITYWYPEEELYEFICSLDRKEIEIHDLFFDLLASRYFSRSTP